MYMGIEQGNYHDMKKKYNTLNIGILTLLSPSNIVLRAVKQGAQGAKQFVNQFLVTLNKVTRI